MDARWIRLLIALNQQDIVSSDSLAELLGVSARTVRSYVHDINIALKSIATISKLRGSGYQLTIDNRPAFDEFLQKNSISSSTIPSTSEERVGYLLNDLLNRSDWITLDNLASILCVSRFTVSDDLKAAEQIVSRFNLSVERRPHRGIRIVGTEFDRRICMASLTMRQLDLFSGALPEIQKMVDAIAECVNKSITDDDFHMSTIAYQNLIVHIAVAIIRLQKNPDVPITPEQLMAIKDSREYLAAQRIAKEIGGHFSITFPAEEVAYIAVHLAGKQTLPTLEDEDSGLVIPSEVWDISGRMVERIWNVFHFDFRGDLELRTNLARHIAPLMVRLRFRMNLNNPMLPDIKQRFPLAYSMAQEAVVVIREHAEGTVSDDEIGYIALAFALALDRQKGSAPNRKRILIVCASGAGSSRLLEHRYRNEFSSYLESVATCDAKSIGQIDFSNIDCVFTTVPLSASLPVPVYQVGMFLDDDDYLRIRSALRSSGSSNSLARFFDNSLFVPHLKARSREDAIAILCSHLAEERSTVDNLETLVLSRERAARTSFGNRVAMPHPIDPVVDESIVCVGLFDDPIDWGGIPVQAVFLVCISRHKDKSLQPLYRGLARLFCNEEAINTLISQQRYELLLELLQDAGINESKSQTTEGRCGE